MRNNIIEGLQMLDAQHAVLVNYLNEYGAQDQRARTAMNVYNGARMMLEAVSGCRVCADTDGRHHAAYSWDDLASWGDFFTETGKRFGLLREFRENGII